MSLFWARRFHESSQLLILPNESQRRRMGTAFVRRFHESSQRMIHSNESQQRLMRTGFVREQLILPNESQQRIMRAVTYQTYTVLSWDYHLSGPYWKNRDWVVSLTMTLPAEDWLEQWWSHLAKLLQATCIVCFEPSRSYRLRDPCPQCQCRDLHEHCFTRWRKQTCPHCRYAYSAAVYTAYSAGRLWTHVMDMMTWIYPSRIRLTPVFDDLSPDLESQRLSRRLSL